MANTTNFNWETPDDTDLVKDGAAAIRTLGSAIDTSLVDLKGGTTGQILSKATNTDMDFTWITNDVGDITEVVAGTGLSGGGSSGSVTLTNTVATEFDAKGDLVVGTGADTFDKLTVGTDNHRLIAASGETTGLKYVADTQNTVIDAAGDLLYGTAADTVGRLAIGTAGQVLKVNSGATAPEWGAAGSGATAQVKSTSKTDTFTMTSTTYADITGLSVSITPTSASNKILIIASVNFNGDAGVTAAAARLMRDSTAIGVGNTAGNRTPATSGGVQGADDDYPGSSSLTFLDSPATTSAITYKVQVRGTGGPSPAVYVNRGLADSDSTNNFRYISTITVMEVTP